MSKIDNVDLWVPSIQQSYCEGNKTQGVDTIRICKLEKFDIREKFVEWEEGKSFKYVATGAPLIKSASNHWSIKPVGNETLIVSYSEIIMKGGIFGRLLEPLIFLATKVAFPNALAPLKYYIETGKPYAGNVKDLPKAIAFC
ncbi:MAG: hypothetical protein L3J15_04055 [Devosiaceae bacterium]|nr:hypothetical protein [Devosiaceae bacterium]